MEIPREVSLSPREVLEQFDQKYGALHESLRKLTFDLEDNLKQYVKTWQENKPDAQTTSELLTQLGSLRFQMGKNIGLIEEAESKIASNSGD